MRLLLLALLAVLLPGCMRISSVQTSDAPRHDAVLPDGPPADLTVPDSAPPDAAPPDTPAPDGEPPCVTQVDSDTLLLYTFSGNGTTVTDATGKHHGTIVGGVARGAGGHGCGQAAVFPNSASDYIEVPDAPAWDLAQGSVDLWLRVDTTTTASVRGIVSRDADQVAKPGHLSVYQLPDGGIAVRLQHLTNQGVVRCSPPLSLGVWHYVGINWGAGGLQLFVDGAEALRTDTIKTTPITLFCGTTGETGIEGNDNPWVLGTSSDRSAEGSALPTSYPFDGAIDSFRISKTRRAFGKSP